MRFSAKKFVLAGVLDKTFAVASRSPSQGVLQFVKVSSLEGDSLRFVGSDAELTVVSTLDQCSVAEAGDVLLPPRIREIIRACADDEIVIESTPDYIEITCQAWEGHIKPEVDPDYPDVNCDFAPTLSFPKEELQRALQRVRPALPLDTGKSALRFVQVAGRKMRATDGSKFHQVDFNFQVELILTMRTVNEVLSRIRRMAAPTVQFAERGNMLLFGFDDDVLMATKWTTEYPDVEAAMLDPALLNDQSVQLHRKELLDVIGRVSQTADPDTNYMTISLTKNAIELTTLDKFGQTSRERMEAYWPYPPRQLGVNWQFLSDVLGAMSEPQVQLFIGDDKRGRLSSLLFREEGFIAVLMQLRQDLGEAAKGSDKVRPAQSAPTGWGVNEQFASELTARKNGQLVVDNEILTREQIMNSDEHVDFDAVVSVGETEAPAPVGAE